MTRSESSGAYLPPTEGNPIMTTTTTGPEPTKQERLAAEGYRPAVADGSCGLCRRSLFSGQWAKTMPDSWQPSSRDREVHWRCHARLIAAVRAKAAGETVPRLPWERRGMNSRDRYRAAYKARQAAAARAAAAPYVEADGPKAAVYVARVVRETGTGPTWCELQQAMGWPRQPYGLGAAIIHDLARTGWLEFTSEPRSLRPGPAASTANGRVR
jgi:hypothetical protein